MKICKLMGVLKTSQSTSNSIWRICLWFTGLRQQKSGDLSERRFRESSATEAQQMCFKLRYPQVPFLTYFLMIFWNEVHAQIEMIWRLFIPKQRTEI